MPANGLTKKQRRFVEEFTVDFNATQAAIRVGYAENSAHVTGSRLLNNAKVDEALQERISTLQMSSDEASIRMAEAARFDIGPYVRNAGSMSWLDVDEMIADGYGWMIKGMKYTARGAPIYELWDSQGAVSKIFDHHKPQRVDITTGGKPLDEALKHAVTRAYGDNEPD